MNSAIGPSFKVVFTEKSTCGSRGQCTGPIVWMLDAKMPNARRNPNSTLIVNYQKRKEKKKERKREKLT